MIPTFLLSFVCPFVYFQYSKERKNLIEVFKDIKEKQDHSDKPLSGAGTLVELDQYK